MTQWTWKYDAKKNEYLLTETLADGVEAFAQCVSRRPNGVTWGSAAGGHGFDDSVAARRSAEENLVIAGWAEVSPGVVARVHEPLWRVVDGALRLAGRDNVAYVTPSGNAVVRRGDRFARMRWADYFAGDIPAACAAAERVLDDVDNPLRRDR